MTTKLTEQQVADLIAENERLKSKVAQAGRVSFKVSNKGALSAYGLGRFPVTLYASQWRTLLAHGEAITAFMKMHSVELVEKGQTPETPNADPPAPKPELRGPDGRPKAS